MNNESERPVNGRFKIGVSDDQVTAYLSEFSPPSNGGKAVSLEVILAALEQKKITVGIDKEKINQIISSPNTNISGEQSCIAKGIAAVDGKDGVLHWCFSEQHLELKDAVVLPGEAIATYQAATIGRPGKTVYGEEISAGNGANKYPRIGAGIETIKTDTGDEYRASHFGLVVFEQEDDTDLIKVNAPIVVADDGMEVRMDIYARSATGRNVEIEHVLAALAVKKIVHGFDQDLIQEYLSKTLAICSEEQIGCLKQVVVARGTPPQEGEAGSLTISRGEKSAGAELSNGRIDFHERDYPWNVKMGEKVGILIEAKPGAAGTPVYGGTVELEPPEDIELELEGLHKELSGDLLVDLDGALIISGNRIAVVDLLVIDGDVAHRTGNIHSKTAVHVKGYVERGFVLESQQEIIVDDNVEDATVRSDNGSVVIKGGVRGNDSNIFSPSDMDVGFVENASVHADGNLNITGCVINSRVTSNAAVVIGGGKRSTVVGGELSGYKMIEVEELGSSAGTETIVRLAIKMKDRKELIQLYKDIDVVKEELEHINQIEYHHQRLPKEDTEEVLQKVAIKQQQLRAKISALEEKKTIVKVQLEESESAKISVRKAVFPGVVVYFNDHSYKVERELGAGSFVYDNEANQVVFMAGKT